MKYRQLHEGEWDPITEPFDLRCCNCTLVHTVTVRIHDGVPEIRFDVNKRATAAVRRARKRKRDGK